MIFTYRQHGSPAPAIVGVDPDTGTDLFTVTPPNLTAGTLTKAFAALNDGSIIAPDFPETTGAQPAVAINLTHVTPDGAPTSIDTGVTGRPMQYLGGYESNGVVHAAVLANEGAHVFTLDSADLSVQDHRLISGYNSSAWFTRAGSNAVLAVGTTLELLDPSDLSTVASVEVDELLDSIIDPWGLVVAGLVGGDQLVLDSTGYDLVTDNVVRVLTRHNLTTLAVEASAFAKDGSNNDSWSRSAMGVHNGALVYAVAVPGNVWRVATRNPVTLALISTQDTSLPGGGSGWNYCNPVGEVHALSDGGLVVGLDVSASVPHSAAAHIDPATLLVAWDALGALQESSGWYDVFGPVAVACEGSSGAPIDVPS